MLPPHLLECDHVAAYPIPQCPDSAAEPVGRGERDVAFRAVGHTLPRRVQIPWLDPTGRDARGQAVLPYRAVTGP